MEQGAGARALSSIAGNAEVLRGSGVELHIAADGIALVPTEITSGRLARAGRRMRRWSRPPQAADRRPRLARR